MTKSSLQRKEHTLMSEDDDRGLGTVLSLNMRETAAW
jgi:hypothetical protein